VCDRQIFNIGSPENEISIRELAELMRDIYQAKAIESGTPISAIIDVSAEEFYGIGYEDSDRRIPNIAKARTLLGWEPHWSLRRLLEVTMSLAMEEWYGHLSESVDACETLIKS
jgi:UDP-apiose/xylose synthase